MGWRCVGCPSTAAAASTTDGYAPAISIARPGRAAGFFLGGEIPRVLCAALRRAAGSLASGLVFLFGLTRARADLPFAALIGCVA